MNEPFKISISAYDTTASWEVDHSDVTIDDVIPGIVSCLIGISFTQEQIISAMRNYLDEC